MPRPRKEIVTLTKAIDKLSAGEGDEADRLLLARCRTGDLAAIQTLFDRFGVAAGYTVTIRKKPPPPAWRGPRSRDFPIRRATSGL